MILLFIWCRLNVIIAVDDVINYKLKRERKIRSTPRCLTDIINYNNIVIYIVIPTNNNPRGIVCCNLRRPCRSPSRSLKEVVVAPIRTSHPNWVSNSEYPLRFIIFNNFFEIYSYNLQILLASHKCMITSRVSSSSCGIEDGVFRPQL